MRFKHFVLTAIMAFFILVGASAPLQAGTITGCGSCFGGTYGLTYNQVNANTFDVWFVADTTNYNGGGTNIDAVAVKVSNSITSVFLTSAPGGLGGWTTYNGGLNSNGCNGAGAGFFCSEKTGPGAPLTNDINTWSWRVVTANLFIGIDQASVKALFEDSCGCFEGLLSNSITLTTTTPNGQVPEPSTFGFAGIAMIGLGLVRRFRK